MDERKFTQPQKAAIVSLMVEMVNIDSVVAFEELVVTNHIFRQLGISSEDFHLGKGLDFHYATQIVRKMPDADRIFVAKLLVDVIDSDGAADSEILLLNKICEEINVTEGML